MKRHALITGICGFIGSNLARKLLSEGWVVDGVDDLSSGRLENLDGLDIRVIPTGDFLQHFEEVESEKRPDNTILVVQDTFSHHSIISRISRGKYDVVFHQAAIPRVLYSVENPSQTTAVNIAETISLFESCVNNVKRVIWASSSSVYGGADTLPTPESHSKDPKSPYAWQKSAIEDAASLFSNLYDLDIVCLRYFNAFGPYQYGDSAYSTAVSAWCHSIKNNLPLRSDGDGSQSRDLCYIDNIVHANYLAACSDRKFKGERYNVACGDRTTNNEILDFLRDRFPDLTIRNAPWRPGDVMHTQADISKIKEDLGYEPLVRFWDGLERTLAWWGLNDNEV